MPSYRHLVITVHGIRTHGHWQERLETLLAATEHVIEVRNHRIGYFSALAFLAPFARWYQVRRFRKVLRAIAGESWDRIDIVAHSFGTHIVSWALQGMSAHQRPQIHTLLLAGSVLRSTFRWDDLLGSSIYRVVNDCGTRDLVLALNQLVVLFTGMAGRVGFVGPTHARFRNRYFRFGHSGYFQRRNDPGYDRFMKKRWVPILTTDRPVAPFDKRTSGTLQGLFTFFLNNIEPVKLCVWLLLVAAPLLFYRHLWLETRTSKAHLTWNAAREARVSGQRFLASHLLADAVADAPARELKQVMLDDLADLSHHAALLASFGPAEEIRGGALFDDDQILIWTAHEARIWDLASGEPTDRYFRLEQEEIQQVHIWDEEEVLIVGDGAAHLWRPEDAERLGPFEHRGLRGASFAWETHLLTWSRGLLKLWHLESQEMAGEYEVDPDHSAAEINKAAALEGRGVPSILLSGCSDDFYERCFGEPIPQCALGVLEWNGEELVEREIETEKILEAPGLDDVFAADFQLDEGVLITWYCDFVILWSTDRLGRSERNLQIWNEVGGGRHSEELGAFLVWDREGAGLTFEAGGQNLNGPPFQLTAGEPRDVYLLEDEDRILVSGYDGDVRVMKLGDGKQVGPVLPHDLPPLDIAILESRREIVTFTRREARRWKMPALRELESPTRLIAEGSRGVELDDGLLLGPSEWSPDEQDWQLMDWAHGGRKVSLEYQGYPSKAAFSADGSSLLILDEREQLYIMARDSGEQLAKLELEAEPLAAKKCADGRVLAVTVDDTVEAWNIDTAARERSMQLGSSRARGLGISLSSAEIASNCQLLRGSYGNQAGLWRLDGEEPTELAWAEEIRLAPDERTFLAKSDGAWWIGSTADGQRIAALDASSFAFLENGAQLLSLEGEIVQLRSLAKGKVLASSELLAGHEADSGESAVAELRWAMDSGEDRVVFWNASRVWALSLPSLDLLFATDISDCRPVSVEPLPSQHQILMGCESGEIRSLSADDGLLIGLILNHGSQLEGIATSHDGERVVSWSKRSVAKVWDLPTRQQIGEPVSPGSEFLPETFIANLRDRRWLVIRADNTYRVLLFDHDRDLPAKLRREQTEALSGQRLIAGQLTHLSPAEYERVSDRWLTRARAHASTCRYPHANTYLRFFPSKQR